MPDGSRIDDLDAATAVTSSDLFVLQQNGTAKKLTGFTLIRDLATELDGHGGIASITEGATTGGKTYFTITFADGTTSQFYSKQGEQGEKGNPLYYSSQDFGSGSTFTATKSNISPASPEISANCFIIFHDGIMAQSTSVSSTTVSCSKLISIKGVGGVDSVNGQSGDVVLDAEDVGARDSTTPISTIDLASGAVTDFHQISIPTTTVWSSAGVVKVATISADWVSASDTIIFDIQPLHGEWADNIAQQEDWAKLVAVLIADGELTFVATEAFQTLVYVGCLRVKR